MKNIIGILILLLLASIAYVLIADVDLFEDNDAIYRDFAIEDTAKVDQVFISEPDGDKILLTRRGFDRWMVEGKYPARPDGVQLILKTLHDIKVQQTVSKTTMPRVIKRLASSAKKIEFYMDGDSDPEKVWYVGDATASRVGTYMLLEKDGKKSKEPLVTHLLMERGSLNSRFFADTVLWKDRIVFKGNPRKIKSIEVIHRYDTATSFKIEKQGEAKFIATNLENGESIAVNPELAIPYFKSFAGIYYEYLDLKSPKEQLDSIYNSQPRHLIKLKMEDGRQYEFRTYNIPVKEGATLNEQPIDYHPERMYISSNFMGEQSHPIVQNYSFNNLVPNFEYFDSSTTVEK